MTKKTQAVNARAQSKAQSADVVLRKAHTQYEAGRLRSAFRLMLSAAKLGDPYGMHGLGYFYDTGVGVKPNRDLAMYWYKRARRRGVPGAANNIGTIYRDEGRPRDALRWFQRAYAAGDIGANLEIARLYLGILATPEAAFPHLERILAAKPGIEVTRHTREQAALLFKELKRSTIGGSHR